MNRVVLIDNGGANIASVKNALARLGVDAAVTRDVDAITAADRVILPGVGAAGEGMQRLRKYRLDEVLPGLRQPVLGICLGMQLLYAASEENTADCLGVFDGKVKKLEGDAQHSVPHMGWNRLEIARSHPVLDGIGEGAWFYFVHSFIAPLTDTTVASTTHRERFTAVVGRGNFIAVQFHPERSGIAGARLLRNFLEWDGCA